MKRFWPEIKWHLLQLFPRTYRTHYWINDERHFVVWKMWLGRQYAITDVTVMPKPFHLRSHPKPKVYGPQMKVTDCDWAGPVGKPIPKEGGKVHHAN